MPSLKWVPLNAAASAPASKPVGGSFDRVQRFVCALYPPTAIALWHTCSL